MAAPDQQLIIHDPEAVKAVGKLFEANKKRILSGVPRTTSTDPSRLLAIAYNSIVYDPKLAKCTHVSLLGGVMEALKLGIAIGGPMQEAWLIPFNTKVSRNPDKWALVATLIIGYAGFRNIIDRGRAVLDLHPRAVHHKDDFDYGFGTHPFIRHKPKAPVITRADLLAVYAVARLRGGGLQMEVLEIPEIEAHRKRSRAADSGPWANENDYVAMALKTSLRKLAKYVPKSSEILARALELDEKADMGVPQDFELPPDVETFDVRPPGELAPPAASAGLDALNDALKGRKPEPVPVERQDAREPGQEG